MADKKEKKNNFNLHEVYDSIEDLEIALTEIADKAAELTTAVSKAHIPANIAVGMLSMPLMVYMDKHHLELSTHIGIGGLLNLFGGFDD